MIASIERDDKHAVRQPKSKNLKPVTPFADQITFTALPFMTFSSTDSPSTLITTMMFSLILPLLHPNLLLNSDSQLIDVFQLFRRESRDVSTVVPRGRGVGSVI